MTVAVDTPPKRRYHLIPTDQLSWALYHCLGKGLQTRCNGYPAATLHFEQAALDQVMHGKTALSGQAFSENDIAWSILVNGTTRHDFTLADIEDAQRIEENMYRVGTLTISVLMLSTAENVWTLESNDVNDGALYMVVTHHATRDIDTIVCVCNHERRAKKFAKALHASGDPACAFVMVMNGGIGCWREDIEYQVGDPARYRPGNEYSWDEVSEKIGKTALSRGIYWFTDGYEALWKSVVRQY